MTTDTLYPAPEAVQFVWGYAGATVAREFMRCHDAIKAGHVPARTIAHQKTAAGLHYRRRDLMMWAAAVKNDQIATENGRMPVVAIAA